MQKNKKIVFVLIGLIIVGGLFIYKSNTDKAVKIAQTPVVSENYKAYATEELAFAENGKVVLFFKASWCPSCRALDKNIKENLSSIPNDLKILEVDYDNSKDLKEKYGVTTQHTLVQVDAQGNMIKKWSGGSEIANIISQIQ